MKLISCTILILLFVKCTSTSEQSEQKNPKEIKSDIVSAQQFIKKTDSCEYDMDTLVIGNESYYVFQNRQNSECEINLTIINQSNDTLYAHDGYATNGFEFEDFNGDGILDVRVHQMTNVGGISDLIMFDQESKRFKEVEYFDNYPSPTKIGNTEFYYSYHKSGCADFNWGSELFTIDDYQVIELGYIEGVGCDDEEKNGIFTYKVDSSIQTKMYSEYRESGYYADKWDFIKNYWTKNYWKFE